ncbi:MAG: T9SS type A sorting domain-containing protein [Flavobacteriales bacterium]|nr:T9SS type A sorting domain-containing protein [Flavobacteriales bacterium]
MITLPFQYSHAQNIALSFDGSDDHVQTAFDGVTGTAARTVEAWIKTIANADPNNGGKQKVICDYGTMSTGARFTFNVLNNNAIRIEVGGSGLGGKITINDGKWHHVAAVYNPSKSNPYALYVDGKLDVEGTISTAINTASASNFMIGKRNDNTNYFEGEIDEVRMYNYAKSDTLILESMNDEFCSSVSGLIAYYKLNEGISGGTNTNNKKARDYSGAGNNGILYNFNLKGTSSNWVDGPKLNGGDTRSSINVFECLSYTIPSKRNTWFFSGTYSDTLVNSNKCDSIITIHLTIGNKYTYYKYSACDSFVSPGGIRYFKSGSYDEVYKTSKGCDSTVTYELSISNSFYKSQTIVACDSFVSVGGNVYHQSGNYTEKHTTVQGCDSIYEYFLTIGKTKKTYDTLESCDSLFFNSQWYFQSTTIDIRYQTSLNCDSVRSTKLVVNPSKELKLTEIACDTFFASNGKFYTSPGIYSDSFSTRLGCDSIVYLDLSIKKSLHSSYDYDECGPVMIGGILYSQSGVYYQTNKAPNGCPWYQTLNVTITPIDTAVSSNGNTLTATETRSKYQWIDCKTAKPITGDTFRTFTPKYNGNFRVYLNLKNCVAESNCYTISSLSLEQAVSLDRYRVYPNPSEGIFNIHSVSGTFDTIEVFDLNGRSVHSEKATNVLDLRHLNKGIFVLKFYDDQQIYVTRILLQ